MPAHILGRGRARRGPLGRSCPFSRARQFQRLATYGDNPRTGVHVCNQRSVRFPGLARTGTVARRVIIIVPSTTPVRQRDLFSAALKPIGARDLTNTVVEVQYAGSAIVCSEYDLPNHDNDASSGLAPKGSRARRSGCVALL